MGMAIMYSPFFVAARLFAGNEKNNPYSLPYKNAIHFGSLLYVFLGLWFLRKSLLRFFNEFVTTITIACLFFGTNLFCYTFALGEMPHGYLFFIFTLFTHAVLNWINTKQAKYLYLFSFLAGFATLIRPTEAVILLFPLLFGINNMANLKQRIYDFFALKTQFIIALLVFILPFFIQMIYWKVYANQWLFFSYGNERFYFNDPQLLNFLVSFRKGWLIYTPMMVFALIGLFYLRRTAKAFFWFLIIYSCINVYVLSCWWDWAFGGSFGCRALIQHYAFFAFAFAAFVSIAFKALAQSPLKYSMQILMCVVLYFFIQLNLNQTWLYKYGIIHFNGMTKEAYFYILNNDNISLEELTKKIKEPDMEAMRHGKRDY